MNIRPIFIAGCDRSGTTLLGDLLGNNQWSVTTPESQFIHDLQIHLQLGTFQTPRQAAEWLYDHFRFTAWNLPLSRESVARLIDLDNPRKTVEKLVQAYALHHHADKLKADVWIDHTPDNFKYHPALRQLFPEARFIHIVRDGRAVCASIQPLNWGPNNAYAASRHWAQRLQQAITVEAAEGSNCLRVRFEDLVSNPEQVLRNICLFVDLPYEEQMLSGGGLLVPEFTRDQHSMVGSRPDATRAYSWRQKLSSAEIRDFESYPLTHVLLSRLGYQPEHPTPPILSSLRILGCYCQEFTAYLKNRMRHKRMERTTVKRSRLRKQEGVIPSAH